MNRGVWNAWVSVTLLALPIAAQAQTVEPTSPPSPKQPLEFLASEYPPEALLTAQEGRIGLNLHINQQGQVTGGEVLGSTNSRALDEAAIEIAKRRWQFESATSSGQPVAADIKIDAEWKLPLTPVYEYNLLAS